MPSSTPFLSIIIPAHNEESRLARTLDEILAFYQLAVLLQPKSSSLKMPALTGHWKLLVSMQAKIRVIIVLHDDKPGKGLAVKTGMLAARGEYRFICDADLSMPRGGNLPFYPSHVHKH